ncbi:hypothetical protein V6N11_056759 [Hibiscus sabdariffa]|uniref:Uncharacterized protein n=1 Tax=Hibiscus sabdariffa TaxID=183260 RepID=A0ABR2T5L3_9ROSI
MVKSQIQDVALIVVMGVSTNEGDQAQESMGCFGSHFGWLVVEVPPRRLWSVLALLNRGIAGFPSRRVQLPVSSFVFKILGGLSLHHLQHPYASATTYLTMQLDEWMLAMFLSWSPLWDLLAHSIQGWLRLNASKTEVFACSMGEVVLANINACTGFKVACLPMSYLGVPLVTRKLNVKDCVTPGIWVRKLSSKMGCLYSVFDAKKQGKPAWVVRTRNWKLREGENRLSGLLEGVSVSGNVFK